MEDIEGQNGIVALLRWHARQGQSRKHEVFAKAADALEKAELERDAALRAVYEAPQVMTECSELGVWVERHGAVIDAARKLVCE